MRGKGILIDDAFDLQINVERDANDRIINGLRVGSTLHQNQALILTFQPGEIKTSPEIGVGIDEVVNDNDYLGWRQLIRRQLEADRQEVKKIAFVNDNKIEIDAKYNR